MTLKRQKVKRRRETGSFIAMPHACLNHENYIALNPHSVKLLFDLYAQYKGKNNGDFVATWSYMKKRGWRSQDTLFKAIKELLNRGWIVVSRQGGRNRCSLYAVTFQRIDECQGKLDITSTIAALGNWKSPQIKIAATGGVLTNYAGCIN